MYESKPEVTQVVSLIQMAENLACVLVPLKYLYKLLVAWASHAKRSLTGIWGHKDMDHGRFFFFRLKQIYEILP